MISTQNLFDVTSFVLTIISKGSLTPKSYDGWATGTGIGWKEVLSSNSSSSHSREGAVGGGGCGAFEFPSDDLALFLRTK